MNMDFVSHALDQCTVGAASRKPTLLWCANLPSMAARMGALPGAGRCCHHGHARSLSGRDAKGQFATASAKQYPEGLCTLISDAIADFVVSSTACECDPMSSEVSEVSDPLEWEARQLFVPLDPYDADNQGWGVFGQDFSFCSGDRSAASGATGTTAPDAAISAVAGGGSSELFEAGLC